MSIYKIVMVPEGQMHMGAMIGGHCIAVCYNHDLTYEMYLIAGSLTDIKQNVFKNFLCPIGC